MTNADFTVIGNADPHKILSVLARIIAEGDANGRPQEKAEPAQPGKGKQRVKHRCTD